MENYLERFDGPKTNTKYSLVVLKTEKFKDNAGPPPFRGCDVGGILRTLAAYKRILKAMNLLHDLLKSVQKMVVVTGPKPMPRGLPRAVVSAIFVILAIAGTACSGEYGPKTCEGDKSTWTIISVFFWSAALLFGLPCWDMGEDEEEEEKDEEE